MNREQGRIAAISISEVKGVPKENTGSAILKNNFGIVGDAHAGSERQVSLLAMESIETMKSKGVNVKPGDFAENITTAGLDYSNIGIGAQITVGSSILFEVTQIGKVCHDRCRIYKTIGDCVMPRDGIFAAVLTGGTMNIGDIIKIRK
ncbi:MAG: MOSC domain-containing protein [bacterium]|nr:MOSC domain-containing protein [bacterium]